MEKLVCYETVDYGKLLRALRLRLTWDGAVWSGESTELR